MEKLLTYKGVNIKDLTDDELWDALFEELRNELEEIEDHGIDNVGNPKS